LETSGNKRSEYIDLRRQYAPKPIKLVVIAESPPASGRYFYNPTGTIREYLFAALMRVLDLFPTTKEEGLLEFQRRGWLLVDATYEPVNRLTSLNKAKVIARDYELLRDDLKVLTLDLSIPLILVKANVCRILEPKLRADGFNVLNRGSVVFFPGSGQQETFHKQFGAILASAGIVPKA
jgi:hypothetical protein